MKKELDKYNLEKKKISYELNIEKNRFITKMLKDKQEIKINAGNVNIKTTIKPLRKIKFLWVVFSRKIKLYYNKLIISLFKN